MSSESPAIFEPSAADRARSAELAALIRAEIASSGGWIGFARYMQLALYAPGLGYYASSGVTIGAAGDFTTAPELADLLPRAVARVGAPLLAAVAEPTILELGAGTGALAEHLLDALDEAGCRVADYRILEPSAALQAQQRERLARFAGRVTWLAALPATPLTGLIVANEVADALPTTCFVKTADGARPLGVASSGDSLMLRIGAADPALANAVAALESMLGGPLPIGYRSEICLSLGAWIASLADTLGHGGLLLIDYGAPRRELYHAERTDGTLICHYRHRAHADPLVLPGLQDLSAWVDFSACAAAGVESGLTLAGFTTQAQLLLATAAELPADWLARQSAADRDALKTLILPGEMGERFKALLMTRAVGSATLPGRDLRAWL